MASEKSTAGADLNIDFNRVSLALAKRQSMLASLMGLHPQSADSPNLAAEEASDDFAVEPELLGVGARKKDGDEDVAHVLSAEARLKRQLLPKRHLEKQSDKSQSQEKVTLPAKRMPTEEEDSEEDAGRSSLGRKKRARETPDQADGLEIKDTNIDMKDEEGPINRIPSPVESVVPAEQKSDVVSDSPTAKKRSKKRRKKNKNR